MFVLNPTWNSFRLVKQTLF